MKDNTLFNIERQRKILQIMKRDGSVNVNHLAQYFNVTQATIRADLGRLEAEGALTRTHGGAIANTKRREPKLNERRNEDKKMRIAQRAIQLVGEQDILLLDTGTTMVSFARALASSALTDVTVFSNDIDVIRILEEKENFSLHLFAGKMRNGYHYCGGTQMISALSNCHFDKLFLSTSAISPTYGLTTANPELAQIKREMLKSADQIILLSDSGKLDQVDFQKFADLDQIDVLIMDSVTSPTTELLKNAVKKLILV